MPQNVSTSSNSQPRNRRRNEQDLVPLLQEMRNQDDEHEDRPLRNKNKWMKHSRDRRSGTATGEPFHVCIEIGDLPSNAATSAQPCTSFNNNTSVNYSALNDNDYSEYSGPKDRWTHTEDVMAREPNFEASGAHVAFYYKEGTRKKHRKINDASASDDDDEDDDDENLNKFISDENDLCGPKHFLLRPLTWLRRIRYALKDDMSSICLLLLLYLLQGIPLGLISAIPLILQSKEVTYGQQAIFSFAYWPFSMKLLWAPIVDSLYCKRIGRRKSWMVPCQYLIGAFLLVISYFVPEILGTEAKDGGRQPPNVVVLMMIFLPLNFLAATQDIAVDGWALTMLSRKNVGYASTCNVVGQTIGFFLGNVVFLTLQSKDFANKYFRSIPGDKGLVEFDGFVFFWGWVFVITTTAVLLFKREVDHSVSETTHQKQSKGDEIYSQTSETEELEFGVVETYGILAKILCLKPMLLMVVVLLTAKIAFAATDGMTDLKLIAAGITTDKIASRSLFLTPLHVILPWLLGKQTSGSKPLNVFLWAYPYRLVMGIVFAALVYWTPSFREANGDYPYLYYTIWIAAYYLHQVSSYCIFLSMMAFNAQISDPKIGGTYMTLLNTLNNLGGNWPVTLFLSITDFFNRKNCVAKGTKIILGTCNTKHDEELCKVGGDICEFVIDGYYISVAICTVIGLLWFKVFYNRIQYFQKIPREEWRVIKNTK